MLLFNSLCIYEKSEGSDIDSNDCKSDTLEHEVVDEDGDEEMDSCNGLEDVNCDEKSSSSVLSAIQAILPDCVSLCSDNNMGEHKSEDFKNDGDENCDEKKQIF